MSLICTCPDCGVKAPLEAFLQDADARRALVDLSTRLADHPAVLRRAISYVGLHAPRGRAANWSKVARLFDELAELVTSGSVTVDRQPRACAPEIWALAMDEAINARDAGTLSLPLSGHGWLKKVAWGKAGQEEARAEAARLGRARGETPVGRQAPSDCPAPDPVSTSIQEIVSDLRALKTLEQGNPGRHAADIARLQQRLAELRPQSTPHGEPTHV